MIIELNTRNFLLLALVVVAVGFTVYALTHFRKSTDRNTTPWLMAVGFITDFLDTLGIGSYATTTALWRIKRSVDDRMLPGTLNVGHAWPTFAQAAIFLVSVSVDDVTLLLLIGSAVVGAWFGAGISVRLSRNKVRLFVGGGLAVAAILMLAGMFQTFPVGGESLGLSGWRLAVGAVACAVFGGLMTLGIGAYAPIMITVSLLGMSPSGAFPIMMGACAFLMPAANIRFLKNQAYSTSAALGLTLGGVPGVLVAAWVVKSIPLQLLKILVVVVASYTSFNLIREAARGGQGGAIDE